MIARTASACYGGEDADQDVPMPPKLDPKDKSMTRQIVITPEWLALVEEWRRHQSPVPNVSAAIRRMVEIAAQDEAERRFKESSRKD